MVGIANGCCKKNYLTTIDLASHYTVHSAGDVMPEVNALATKGLSKSRKKDLVHGLELAIAVRRVFNEANPRFPPDHWHYAVANAADLKALVSSGAFQHTKLSLSADEQLAVSRELERMGDATLSFSMFCVTVRCVIRLRSAERMSVQSRRQRQTRQPSLAELFLSDDEMERLTQKIRDANTGLDNIARKSFAGTKPSYVKEEKDS